MLLPYSDVTGFRYYQNPVKRFVEIAASGPMDGKLHISHIRKYHGGEWTQTILRAVLSELREPTMQLDIAQSRASLIPFFESQLARRQQLADAEFGYQADRSK